MTNQPAASGDVTQAVIQKLADMLTKHHQWHAAQTDPDPEHGFIPADEYCESSLYDQTVEALGLANNVLTDGRPNTAASTPAGEREREALEEFCLAAECAAGADEGASHEQASSDIMSAMGSAMAVAYDKARRILALPPATQAGDLSPEDAWQDLVDKDDRTSPEEYPDMALITFDELRDYMLSAAPTPPKAEPSVAEGERIRSAHPEVHIPAGMKPWAGGDSAPEDWDRSKDSLMRNGVRFPATYGEPYWQHIPGRDSFDIIAYTPLATPQPEASVEVREALKQAFVEGATDGRQALHDGEVWDMEARWSASSAALKSGGAK